MVKHFKKIYYGITDRRAKKLLSIYGDPRQDLTTSKCPFPPPVANNDIKAFSI